MKRCINLTLTTGLFPVGEIQKIKWEGGNLCHVLDFAITQWDASDLGSHSFVPLACQRNQCKIAVSVTAFPALVSSVSLEMDTIGGCWTANRRRGM